MVPFVGRLRGCKPSSQERGNTHVARMSFPRTCTRIERIVGKPVGKIERVFVGGIVRLFLLDSTTLSWKRLFVTQKTIVVSFFLRVTVTTPKPSVSSTSNRTKLGIRTCHLRWYLTRIWLIVLESPVDVLFGWKMGDDDVNLQLLHFCSMR
jgi:hypothetical protein